MVGGAGEVHRGRGPAQGFLHRRVQGDLARLQRPPLMRVFGQCPHRADGGDAGRLVAAQHDAVAVQGDFLQREGLVVDLRAGEHTHHVVARVGPSFPRQVHEVQDDLVAGLEGVQRVGAGRLRRQGLLVPPQQSAAIDLGNGEQVTDGVHGDVLRHLGGEVERPGSGHLTHQALGARPHLPGDRLQCPGREGAPHHGSHGAMAGPSVTASIFPPAESSPASRTSSTVPRADLNASASL